MVDTSKKANRKCEYCEHWKNYRCDLTGASKNYWNSCKQFEWRACYVSPENVAARKRLYAEKMERAVEKKDQEVKEALDLYHKAVADRKAVYHQMVLAKREYLGTKHLRPGDTLYYIDYEVSGSCYTIVQELSIEDDDYIKPGEYFVVKPEGIISQNGFVRIEEVNDGRFFTNPEKAHEAYVKWTEGNKQTE